MSVVVLAVVAGVFVLLTGALAMAYLLEKQRRLQLENEAQGLRLELQSARESTLEQRGHAV